MQIAAAAPSVPVTVPAPSTNATVASPVTLSPTYSPEEEQELAAQSKIVADLEARANDYYDRIARLVATKHQAQRTAVFDGYETIIMAAETEQRQHRAEAIAVFENFLTRYPNDLVHTPDAMFRLAELYYERSYDHYFQARQAYEKQIETADAVAQATLPNTPAEIHEPVVHYDDTIRIMRQLTEQFPEFRLVDGALYLLGYCYGEQGDEATSTQIFEELVIRTPHSRFAPEVWTRIGEHYFGEGKLPLAMRAYKHVLKHKDSPFYDKGLYKLAWTHYRMADADTAPEQFQKAVDTFVDLLEFNHAAQQAGQGRGAELHAEAVRYIAVSFTEERWGSPQKMLAYVARLGNKPYVRDMLLALADASVEQTRFVDAALLYATVQKRFPLAKDAPQVQDKLIRVYEKDRNFPSAFAARKDLITNFGKNSAWHALFKHDVTLMRELDTLMQNTMYAAAVFYHQQAQNYKNAEKFEQAKAEYNIAASLYQQYIATFPHDQRNYELSYYYADCLYYSLQFDAAIAAFIDVRDNNYDDTYLMDAALSAVLAYENAMDDRVAAGTLAPLVIRKNVDRKSDEALMAQTIPEFYRGMVDASDRYMALADKSDKADNAGDADDADKPDDKIAKILYKTGEVFYAFDHVEEARRRFNDVLARFSHEQVAEYAANWIIETYLAEKNYPKVQELAGTILARPEKMGSDAFRADMLKFKAGAMFKVAEALADKDDTLKAAELYLQMVNESPHNAFADAALNNAAVAYEKLKRFDSASKLYERLAKEYPQSPLADAAMFRVGLNAERFFDFKKAITIYMRVVRDFPKSAKRPDALYNGALALDNVQDYEGSATQYLRYCQLFPDRADAPQVCFRAGTIYEKMRAPARVIATYKDFVRMFGGNKEHRDRVVEAYLRIAKAYESLKERDDAARYYNIVVDTYRKTPHEKIAPYAAEAEYQLSERSFAAFDAMPIAGSALQQQKTLTEKAERLKKVEAEYKRVLKFKQIQWTLASLFRIGQLYDRFADSVINAPCPPDVKRTAKEMGATEEEVCMEYRALLEEKSVNIEDKAVHAYETTITRAREFQVANEWTQKTLVALNRLRKQAWPLQQEAKTFVEERIAYAPAYVDMPALPPSPAPPSAAPPASPSSSSAPGKAP